MLDKLQAPLLTRLGLLVLYTGLFWLTEQLQSAQIFDNTVSLIFLPAFVRLMAFLVIGWEAVPLLIAGGFLTVLLGLYDLGPGEIREYVMTIFGAVGGPLGAWLGMKFLNVSRSLTDLSPPRLLFLSLACALGNALTVALGLSLIGASAAGLHLMVGILVGDTIGTWLAILTLKACFTYWGRRL